MIEVGSEILIYYNSNYDNMGECYLIYCNGGGLYLSTPDEYFKVLQKNYPSKVTLENIDEYAFSRHFERMMDVRKLTYDNSKDIIWYRNDTKFKERLRSIVDQILYTTKYSIFPDAFIIHFYCLMNTLLQNI